MRFCLTDCSLTSRLGFLPSIPRPVQTHKTVLKIPAWRRLAGRADWSGEARRQVHCAGKVRAPSASSGICGLQTTSQLLLSGSAK
jgi:hypothetical protein